MIARSPVKRIALLYDHVLDVGGVENHLLSLLRHVNAQDFQFILISPVSERFRQQVIDLGASVVTFSHWLGLNPLTSIRLARLLKAEKIDVVHAHSPIAALSGRLAAFYLGIPAIVTTHLPVTQYHGIKQTPTARFGRWLYTQLDRLGNYCLSKRLIFVSQKICDQCIADHLVPKGKTVVIPVGIPLEVFLQHRDKSALRNSNGVPVDSFIFTFVGRLSEQKGLDFLLEACEPVLREDPKAQLWLIGDGSLHLALEEKAAHLRIASQVKFWGWQLQIAEWLAQSDLFVLPSLYEGTPISLLEALASGLPVIATDVGENVNLLQNGLNGYCVPAGNVKALERAIYHLKTHPEERSRLSDPARQTAQCFDEQALSKQVEKLYRSVSR